ncbi:hypothetical protein ACG83_12530 [Frankia sp. R43]|uniref:LysR family transcriptional regulator n=1 Tax=Frankia sp. R43 TaxID=269536 RepID=UPI0006CA56BC|nr:LysR substrate-binding domain-containing protein [Frankia sp. R43]KPM56009.1 hypothetical protein ACG83_12530 [Frankia sp. R43]
MEIKHIRSFLAVAEELHFSRAAKRVHVTQPTLSQHIQILERDLAVQLVNRTSRKVELTPSGEAFLMKARNAIAEFEQARENAQLAAVGRIGSIKVGYSVVASRTVLPGAVSAFQGESQRVHVQLQQLRTGPQLAALEAGELDMAITSGKPSTSDLSAHWLHPIRVQVVVVSSDRLAGLSAVRFSDLANRPCILFERAQSPMMYDAIASSAMQAGVDLKVADVVSDPWHANALVAARAMVAFTTGVDRERRQTGPHVSRPMTYIPLVDPTPRLALHAMWRKSSETPLLVRFINALDAAAAAMAMPGGSGSPTPPGI